MLANTPRAVPKVSIDDAAYELFCDNCERLGQMPANRQTWERITRGISECNNMWTVKASNRMGG